MDVPGTSIEDFLECSVCLEALDERSRVLPCQHTFCLKCLSKVVAGRGYIQCPECRTDYHNLLLKKLPRNVLLVRILEGLKNDEIRQRSSSSAANQNGRRKSRPRRRRRYSSNTLAVKNESAAFQNQPCARALYDFQSTEEGDLSFVKGDVISLVHELDENWMEGVFRGKRGSMPKNFLEILVPLPKLEDESVKFPLAKALHTCEKNEDPELLPFREGDVIFIIRKVDENWMEGIMAHQYGIVPINFLQLNKHAKALIATPDSSSSASSSSGSEEEVDTSTKKEKEKPTETQAPSTTSPWVKLEKPKRHTIHVENPNEQNGYHQNEAGAESSSTVGSRADVRRCSESATQVTPRPASASITTPRSSNEQLTAPSVPPAAQPRSNRSTQQAASTSSSNSRPNSMGEIFTAMFNYSPCQDDELALLQGDKYCVQEKHPDGWFKGYHIKSKHSGVFPGNYVKPSSQVVMNRSVSSSASLNTVACGCRSNPSSPGIHNGPAFNFSRSATVALGQNGARVRSGSEPTEMQGCARHGCARMNGDACARVLGSSPKQSGVSSLLKLLKKKKKSHKRPALLPPQYSHPAMDDPMTRYPARPSPMVPCEPPPPYTPTDVLAANVLHSRPPLPYPTNYAGQPIHMRERYRAVAAYPASQDGELSLKVGDNVIVTQKLHDGWYRGKSQRSGRTGLFPSTFVESC